jgi:N-acetylmuramoyl-L-alanine amidase
MEKRREICESENPHLILSIHQNFYSSTLPRGGQVFYQAEGSKDLSEALQESLNDFYQTQGAKGRKVMKGDFFMLQFSPPSVIVECGFLSNEEDERILTTANGREKIVSALVFGVISFFEGKYTA